MSYQKEPFPVETLRALGLLPADYEESERRRMEMVAEFVAESARLGEKIKEFERAIKVP